MWVQVVELLDAHGDLGDLFGAGLDGGAAVVEAFVQLVIGVLGLQKRFHLVFRDVGFSCITPSSRRSNRVLARE